jgi:hypothetical protein
MPRRKLVRFQRFSFQNFSIWLKPLLAAAFRFESPACLLATTFGVAQFTQSLLAAASGGHPLRQLFSFPVVPKPGRRRISLAFRFLRRAPLACEGQR